MAPAKARQKEKPSTDAGARPQWPALEPRVEPDDFTVNHLLQGQIVTLSNFWPKSLCKNYVKFLSGLPLTTTPGVPKRGDAVRVNDRFQVDDAAFANRLWTETNLREVVMRLAVADAADPEEAAKELWGGQVLGLNPNIRIYRYKPGQFFDQHYDESNNVMLPGPPSVAARTTWTLLLYLTSPGTGCMGGETIFYPEAPAGKRRKGEAAPEPIVVGLETGMALLHRHGKECMLHEGSEVTEGEKWVIRSDIVVRR